MWQRISQFLDEYPEAGYALLSGLGFELLTLLFNLLAVFKASWYSGLASLCSGIGTSLLAATVFSFFSYLRQQYHQQFAKLGIRKIYPHRNHVPDDEWCARLGNSKQRSILIGVAHEKWCHDVRFPAAVKQVVSRRVELKMFFLKPTSPISALRTNEEERESGRNTERAIRGSIAYMWRLKSGLPPAEQEFLRIFVYDAMPIGTTWIDDWLLVTHYLSGTANVTSPCLILVSMGDPADLFAIYRDNVEKIETHSSVEIDQTNVEEYS